MKLSLALSSLLIGRAAAENVVEVAIGLPETFSTLVDLVVAAELDETLSTAENITVFAPVNAAFEDLPDEIVANLLTEEWKTHLQDVLLYHVLGSVVPSTAITDGLAAPTLNGEEITLTLPAEGGVIVNGNASVVEADVAADNGLIHAIDAVLLPSWLENSIVDRASDADDLSQLVGLVVEAGLAETLSGPGPFTVFAPTNDAITEALAMLAAAGISTPLDPALLTAVLTYHVVPGIYPAGSITDGLELTTLQGEDITFALSDGNATVNELPILLTDILANNGIVHVIGGVLVPEAALAPPEEGAPTEAPDVPEGTPTDAPAPEVTPTDAPAPEGTPTEAPSSSSQAALATILSVFAVVLPVALL
jgi:transforming growth factor-beta-induced protein